jgi:2,3,4,5-tetrahydropyridine-2-carboxylate N-succinyltransferase
MLLANPVFQPSFVVFSRPLLATILFFDLVLPPDLFQCLRFGACATQSINLAIHSLGNTGDELTLCPLLGHSDRPNSMRHNCAAEARHSPQFASKSKTKIQGNTMPSELANRIEAAWEARDSVTPQSAEIRADVEAALAMLDSGEGRVAEPDGEGGWTVNQWLKKAVLLSFRLNDNALVEGGSAGHPAYDKVPSKFAGWDEARFKSAGFRVVPGAIAREGAFIGAGCVLMPSFVNIGAYVGEGTMVDTWGSIGSCAQIGKNCHISAGTGIGGVLEPMQANPTIIGDNCFIGARSEIVEGVIVGEGCVVAMGVFITQSTKIVNRETGDIIQGRIPPYSVVVPGTLPDPKGGPSLACAVIVKTVDAQTRAKTGINDLLRD